MLREVADSRATLARPDRVEGAAELGPRGDDSVTAVQRGSDDTDTDRCGRLEETRFALTCMTYSKAVRARSDWRSHSNHTPVALFHSCSACPSARRVRSGGSPYVGVSRKVRPGSGWNCARTVGSCTWRGPLRANVASPKRKDRSFSSQPSIVRARLNSPTHGATIAIEKTGMSDAVDVLSDWTKGPLDMLSHAHKHLVEGTDSANRYALLGFDQAVEGSIAAYLRYGPGFADDNPLASQARKMRSNFWAKVNYLDARLKGMRRALPVPLTEVTRIHDIRNDLQHDGGWMVPSHADAEISRSGAVAVFEAIADLEVGTRFAPVVRVLFEFPDADDLFVDDRSGHEPDPMRKVHRARPRVAPFLYELARSNDPEREGMHVTTYVRLAAAAGATSYSYLSVASGLNNAHDLFDRVAPAVYAWKEESGPPATEGVTGRALADVAYEWCRSNDPSRSGMHYNRDIKAGLERWGVAIRGHDKGRTIRQSLNRDSRFDGERGLFRWRA